jgi:hypothetical protein
LSNTGDVSNVALEWLLKEAIDAGLIVDQAQLDSILGRKGVVFAASDPRVTISQFFDGRVVAR